MFCTKCGARMESDVCPVCGYHREAPNTRTVPAAPVGQTTVLSPAGDLPFDAPVNAPYAAQPSYSAAPSYEEPEPFREAPTYRPEPSYSAPEPSYEEPEPFREAPAYRPKPSYSAPEPSYEEPKPFRETLPAYRPEPSTEQPYTPPTAPSFANAPALQLRTRRGLGKMFWLGLITFSIYPTVVYSHISGEINLIASRYDGKRTMHYLGMSMLSAITLGIVPLVWNHRLATRIGTELTRRGIGYDFRAKHFWLWNILGSLILVGPFIYIHKLMKAMNLLCENYNRLG